MIRETLQKSKTAIQSKAWRENNPEKYRLGMKAAKAKKRADPEKWAKALEQNRKSNKRNYSKRREYDRNRDKDKVNARRILRNHLRSGKIQRGSCEICGSIKTDGHHENYREPLNVKWLCRQHHLELHRKEKRL